MTDTEKVTHGGLNHGRSSTARIKMHLESTPRGRFKGHEWSSRLSLPLVEFLLQMRHKLESVHIANHTVFLASLPWTITPKVY